MVTVSGTAVGVCAVAAVRVGFATGGWLGFAAGDCAGWVEEVPTGLAPPLADIDSTRPERQITASRTVQTTPAMTAFLDRRRGVIGYRSGGIGLPMRPLCPGCTRLSRVQACFGSGVLRDELLDRGDHVVDHLGGQSRVHPDPEGALRDDVAVGQVADHPEPPAVVRRVPGEVAAEQPAGTDPPPLQEVDQLAPAEPGVRQHRDGEAEPARVAVRG